MEKIILICPCILFFLMLFVPTTYTEIKIPLIIITITTIAISALKQQKKRVLSDSILNWVSIQVCSGLFFILLGIVNKTPGALRVSSVIMAWPVLYTIYIAGISNKKILENILNVLLISSIVIPSYIITFILATIGAIPSIFYVEIDQGQIFDDRGNELRLNLYSLGSLVFLSPYMISKALSLKKEVLFLRILTYIAVFLTIIALVVSGRRGLLLSSLISPVVHFVIINLSREDPKMKKPLPIKNIVIIISLLLSIAYVLSSFLGIELQPLIERVISISDFDNDDSNVTRKEQLHSLLVGWYDSPIFGAGHGASAERYGSLRGGEDQPWAYELSYISMLYQTGIVGFLIWWSGIVWIVITSIKIIKTMPAISNQLTNLLTGMIGFLVANASNPYFGKYDHMWAVYLPLAVINLSLIGGQIKNNEENI
jgi:hypothetical protein